MKKICCVLIVSCLVTDVFGQVVPKRFTLVREEVSTKETFPERPEDGVMIVKSNLDAPLDFESNEIPNFNYVYDSEKNRYLLFFTSGADRMGINQIVTIKARGYTHQEFTERLKLAKGDVVYYAVRDPELEKKSDSSPWIWVGIAAGIAVGITAAIVIATQISPASGGGGNFGSPPGTPTGIHP